ncbi:sugar phosphate nucleotidyltransferase [Patescibacteria group bacterium]
MSKRQRLTITLRDDILNKLDNTIDDHNVRNRSHAIERILSENLGPKIKNAIILTNGKGVRMRPFTYEMPKCMIPVHDRPILEYSLDILRDYGLKDVIIGVGYLGDKIKKHFQDGSRFGMRIIYNEEKRLLGNGGALGLARGMTNETFFLIYGDVLADINLRNFVEFHKLHDGIVSMALNTAENTSDWGVVRLNGTRIVKITEKPDKAMHLSGLINAGVFIVEPKIFDFIPANKPIVLEKHVFPKLISEKKLYGYPFDGQWFDVSTPKIYEKVLKEWKK